jgi:hypothetical protein
MERPPALAEWMSPQIRIWAISTNLFPRSGIGIVFFFQVHQRRTTRLVHRTV